MRWSILALFLTATFANSAPTDNPATNYKLTWVEL
jgi:hypothetical protein